MGVAPRCLGKTVLGKRLQWKCILWNVLITCLLNAALESGFLQILLWLYLGSQTLKREVITSR